MKKIVYALLICLLTATYSYAQELLIPLNDDYEMEIQTAAYSSDYRFHTADNLLGYWYNIWLPESIRYEESFFDIASKGVPYVEVVPKWSDYVAKILSFYINESPYNKIAVLLRIQDRSNDIVHPACSLSEFVQALSDGNIKWNELYFVN